MDRQTSYINVRQLGVYLVNQTLVIYSAQKILREFSVLDTKYTSAYLVSIEIDLKLRENYWQQTESCG